MLKEGNKSVVVTISHGATAVHVDETKGENYFCLHDFQHFNQNEEESDLSTESQDSTDANESSTYTLYVHVCQGMMTSK